MKPTLLATVLACAVLAACNAQQPAAPASPPAAPATATPEDAAANTSTGETAMGKRAAGDTTPPMSVFRAFGNEPFWNVNVEDSTLTFTTPDDQVGVVMQGERRSLPDGGVEITGTHDGKPFAVKVSAGSCNDGMSDNQYALVSSFRFGDIDYTGCGEAAK